MYLIIAIELMARYIEFDLATFCKLDCIAQQIDQNLAQPVRVTDYVFWNGSVNGNRPGSGASR